jgi:hypothetical protein
MMGSTHLVAGIAVAALLAVSADAATMTQGAVGYALGNNGATLVTIGDLSAPSSAVGAPLRDASGAAIPLSALAWRPQTRQLYGYADQTDTVYLVDPSTGRVEAVASMAGATSVGEVGFDFNNVIDAARIVSVADDNLVFFPKNTPANIARFTDLFYGPSDPNAGRDPGVFANAYTNAVPNASTTLQYVLDGEWDILATLANNTGVLSTVGEIWSGDMRVDFSTTGGFDILSFAEGDNRAFALLHTAQGGGLYSLSLMPDAQGRIQAELLGATGGAFGVLEGLAVAPAPVPLPAAGWMLLAGVGGLAALRRKAR